MADVNWDDIIGKAVEKTDKEFASEFSGLTRLTDEELKAFIKTPADKENFARLVAVVKDKTKNNQEKAKELENINGVFDIIAPILGKML